MQLDAPYARQLDDHDGLAAFRDEFFVADPQLIYLDGNSLGRLPRRNRTMLENVLVHEWGERLIRAWNEGWYEAPMRIGAKIARLLGASEDEVIVADSTSVNLYKLATSALAARRARTKVVTDDMNFPSDLYILRALTEMMNSDIQLEIVKSPDGLFMPLERIDEAIDQGTVLLTLSHTAFKSGFTYDMSQVNSLAHQAGALVLWDLSHSAGALDVRLNEAGADLAVGCTYKYLNGGPGSPAFLYVRKDLQEELLNPIPGWFAQEDQFAMEPDFQPASSMRRYLTGTPATLSLLGIEAGVDLLLEAGVERLRDKSVRQTEYLIKLWESELQSLGFDLKTPRDAEQRGSHVALGHKKALPIDLTLIHDMKVLVDFRPPDVIRLGVAPIYTTFGELHEAVRRIRRVVEEGLFEKYEGQVPTVT